MHQTTINAAMDASSLLLHTYTTDHVCFIPDLNFRVEVLYNKIITKCRHRRCYMCCYPNLQGWNDAAAGIYSRE